MWSIVVPVIAVDVGVAVVVDAIVADLTAGSTTRWVVVQSKSSQST